MVSLAHELPGATHRKYCISSKSAHGCKLHGNAWPVVICKRSTGKCGHVPIEGSRHSPWLSWIREAAGEPQATSTVILVVQHPQHAITDGSEAWNLHVRHRLVQCFHDHLVKHQPAMLQAQVVGGGGNGVAAQVSITGTPAGIAAAQAALARGVQDNSLLNALRAAGQHTACSCRQDTVVQCLTCALSPSWHAQKGSWLGIGCVLELLWHEDSQGTGRAPQRNC